MNWTVLIIFGIAAIALVIFLVVRNKKDEKDFEEQINKDYHKAKDEEGDIKIEEETK
ncbi:MAG: LPXTG cell wall anchor domain-containing protein [Ferruginibacter sp.]|nr:LPXTG cell wall anchor domain-containing protein [Ferruginibacter sp.]